MLLTQSIRWKLVSGLGLVLILVVFAATCSLLSVSSYHRTVEDLELSISKIPRRPELIDSISRLIAPISMEFPDDSSREESRRRVAELQFVQFMDVYQQVAKEVRQFELNWQQLPPKLRQYPREETGYTTIFATVDDRLEELGGSAHLLKDPARRTQQVQAILQNVQEMIDVIRRGPDPANRLGERLRQAQADYRFHLNLVAASGAVSVAVLIGLMIWGYGQIFAPIQSLHQGVRRIADGDYNYRLRITTRCEIGELAETFNVMARRIQEDREHKQQEIEDRSKQLILSERLAGAGFLASGVAHEINNPLTVIMTAAYGLETRLSDQALSSLKDSEREEIRQYLALIQSESERCERITKKLLDFSHGKGEERNLYDVTAIVNEVVSMVGHLSRYQDRLISVNRTSPLHAWINAPEIKQVLLNLVANALDATSAGGHVDISLKDCPDEVQIAVRDDGCGLTAEQKSHIFEPFFTTKDVGKGTGLGLAITHRIVRDHGGTLEVSSDGPGRGARFCLRLPRSAVQSKAA